MDAFIIINSIYICVICLTGLPGNLMIILVFGRKLKKISTDIYITALAITEWISCWFYFFQLVWLLRPDLRNDSFCGILWSSSRVLAFMAAQVTLFIAMDRYFAICKPRVWNNSKNRATIACAIASILSLVGNVQYAIFTRAETSGNNVACTFLGPRWLNIIGNISVNLIIPVCVVCVWCYSNIWIAMKRQARVMAANRLNNLEAPTTHMNMNSVENSTSHACHVPRAESAKPKTRYKADTKSALQINTNNDLSASSQEQSYLSVPHQHRQQNAVTNDKSPKRKFHSFHNSVDVSTAQEARPKSRTCFEPIITKEYQVDAHGGDSELTQEQFNSSVPHQLPNRVEIKECGPSSSEATPEQKHGNIHHSPKKQRGGGQQKRDTMTKMLLLVTIIYMTTMSPSIVLENLPKDIFTGIQETKVGEWGVFSGYALRGINFTVNFFIYIAMNKRFKHSCLQLFKRNSRHT